MNAQALPRVGLQRLGDHDRSEIRPADADVHDVGDGLARVARPRARADRRRELLHVREDAIHVGHHVATVDDDGTIRAIAKRDVQDRAVLRDVDLLAGEHPARPTREIRLRRERAQQRHRLVRHAILREIEEQILEAQRQLLEAFRIVREEVAQVHRCDGGVMCGESFPGGRLSERVHARTLLFARRRRQGDQRERAVRARGAAA